MITLLWTLAACGKPPACKEEVFCPLPPEDDDVHCSWEGYEAAGFDACFARMDLVGQLCTDEVSVDMEVVFAEMACTSCGE